MAIVHTMVQHLNSALHLHLHMAQVEHAVLQMYANALLYNTADAFVYTAAYEMRKDSYVSHQLICVDSPCLWWEATPASCNAVCSIQYGSI